VQTPLKTFSNVLDDMCLIKVLSV